MPPATITDLPTETLLKVLQNPTVHSETLYFLVTTAQCIGLDEKSAAVILDVGRWDTLSALQVSLSLPSLERLEFTFSAPELHHHFPIPKTNETCRNIHSRLSSVKEVSLILDTTPFGRCLSLGSDEALRTWVTQLNALLTCIVDRGCTSLTVINGTQFSEAFQLGRPGFLQNCVPRVVRQAFQDAQTFSFRRDRRQGTDKAVLAIPLFSNPASHLQALRIDSMTLILPAGLRWTLAALRCSPIKSLWMRMSHVEPHVWSRVLPLIASAAANLTSVSLTELHSPSESHGAPGKTYALAFLARLPHLTDVELTHGHALWGYNINCDLMYLLHRTRGSTPAFAQLTTLRAPANIIAHILSQRDTLPAIRTVCILWKAPTHPHLRALVAFISTITSRLSARGLTPQLSLSIDALGSLDPEDFAVLENLSAAQLARFARIERIVLEHAFPPSEYSPQPFLGPLLAAFQGVKYVSVNTGASDVTASAKRIAREVRATEVLNTIDVNGRTYKLSNNQTILYSSVEVVRDRAHWMSISKSLYHSIAVDPCRVETRVALRAQD
ncbi:hypothetical protein DFH06DRAFT_1128844 [Mycena polygramma]|nr:hypothetical protein DFH06DRAFT_1128844 [Mycena polygramma]